MAYSAPSPKARAGAPHIHRGVGAVPEGVRGSLCVSCLDNELRIIC